MTPLGHKAVLGLRVLGRRLPGQPHLLASVLEAGCGQLGTEGLGRYVGTQPDLSGERFPAPPPAMWASASTDAGGGARWVGRGPVRLCSPATTTVGSIPGTSAHHPQEPHLLFASLFISPTSPTAL